MLGAVGDLRDMGQSHTVHAGHALHAGEESVLNKESWVRVYMMCVICWKRKCLYKKKKAVVPNTFTSNTKLLSQNLCVMYISILHKRHMGADRTKQLANEAVYWSNMRQDTDTAVSQCPSCTTSKVHPHQSPHPFPSLGNFESSYFWLEHYQYPSLISLMVSVDVKHHVYFTLSIPGGCRLMLRMVWDLSYHWEDEMSLQSMAVQTDNGTQVVKREFQVFKRCHKQSLLRPVQMSDWKCCEASKQLLEKCKNDGSDMVLAF